MEYTFWIIVGGLGLLALVFAAVVFFTPIRVPVAPEWAQFIVQQGRCVTIASNDTEHPDHVQVLDEEARQFYWDEGFLPKADGTKIYHYKEDPVTHKRKPYILRGENVSRTTQPLPWKSIKEIPGGMAMFNFDK